MAHESSYMNCGERRSISEVALGALSMFRSSLASWGKKDQVALDDAQRKEARLHLHLFDDSSAGQFLEGGSPWALEAPEACA
mmetsp:Transcript_53907/g.156622  ORF Transcript_53907/g.156622 Transcript_53907/m.156622 type:complete len:82 (-) Transcript_53907:122-367(-)